MSNAPIQQRRIRAKLIYPKKCQDCGIPTSGRNKRCRPCGCRFGKLNGNPPKHTAGPHGKAWIHRYIKKRLIKPLQCDRCHETKPLDLANISQEYKKDLADWEWLCRSCHMTTDGRLAQLLSHNDVRKVPERKCKNCGITFKSRGSKPQNCSLACARISGGRTARLLRSAA